MEKSFNNRTSVIYQNPQHPRNYKMVKRRWLMVPMCEYKVSVPYPKPNTLNLFQMTILKLLVSGSKDDDYIAKALCLNIELVSFIVDELEQYKLIKNTAKKLKYKEQPFWVYKYCISAEYKYNTDSIIKAYNSYRFDLNKRLLENKDYKVIDNIASYLPVNLKKGSNYLYYLGMRNNIIEWSEDNDTMHITLPIMFSGIITTMSLEEDKSILVKEIFVYDRPEGLPQNGGYKNLFIK